MSSELPIIGVTGSRSLNGQRDQYLVFCQLDEAWKRFGPFRLAHGCCPEGADRFAAQWCEEREVTQVPFPPETRAAWAFHKRNRALVGASERLIAFWDGTLSRGGTIYTMRYAASQGKPVHDVLAASQGRKKWKPER